MAYGIFSEFGLVKLGKACFLVATERLHKSACPSVRPLFQQSVTLLVTLSLFGLLGATHGVTRPCYEAKAETAEEAEGGEVTKYPLPPLIEEPLTATASPEQKQ